VRRDPRVRLVVNETADTPSHVAGLYKIGSILRLKGHYYATVRLVSTRCCYYYYHYYYYYCLYSASRNRKDLLASRNVSTLVVRVASISKFAIATASAATLTMPRYHRSKCQTQTNFTSTLARDLDLEINNDLISIAQISGFCIPESYFRIYFINEHIKSGGPFEIK